MILASTGISRTTDVVPELQIVWSELAVLIKLLSLVLNAMLDIGSKTPIILAKLVLANPLGVLPSPVMPEM